MSPCILSWNINGLRSLKTDMKEFLTGLKADIVCLQETKVTRDMLKESQAIVEGFSSYFSFSRKKSGYSGVVTFCSKAATPFAAQEGLSGLLQGELSNGSGDRGALPGTWREEELKDLDSEGRAVMTQHKIKDENGKEREITIINVYCPRVDPEKPERRHFKLRFYELLRQRAAAIRGANSHVIVLGDINTSHKRIDHCDPDKSEDFENRLERRYLDRFLKPLHFDDDECSQQEKTAPICKKQENGLINSSESLKIFSELEEEEFQLLASSTNFQMVDTFRYFHPFQKDAFTCWNVSTNSRSTNYGTRIDCILCDEDFLPILNNSMVLQDVMGSDHCPVAVIVAVEFIPSSQLPSCCTQFFPEFRGHQQKLSSYFQSRNAFKEHTKLPLHKPTENSENANKRKILHIKGKSADKRHCTEKQMTINSFFSVNTNNQVNSSVQSLNNEKSNYHNQTLEISVSTSDSLSSDFLSHSSSQSSGSSRGTSSTQTQSYEVALIGDCKKSNQAKNQGWSFLMKGPKPPPLCPGHKEPCVLQTVKKKGPNQNRQFYACARGVGKEGDPNARCNFFKWASQ